MSQRSPDTAESPAVPGRPSTWFTWHQEIIGRGTRVLDAACGAGRHSLAAATLGADVTALDKDSALLDAGRQAARELGVEVTWLEWDLTESLPPLGTFDVMLIFNYLDRAGLPDLLEFLRPGGYLMMETFLEDQLAFDWGPTNSAHLLRRGELAGLVVPLEIVHAREALEPHEGVRWSALASVLARKVS